MAQIQEICSICLEELTNIRIPVKLPCNHRSCYNCICGVKENKCPLCRANIPPNFLKDYKTSENVFDGKSQPLWMYESRDSVTFWYFQMDQSEEIEEAYQKFIKKEQKEDLYLTIRGQNYKIDFSKMIQISPMGISRIIKRRDEKNDIDMVKGVSGVLPK